MLHHAATPWSSLPAWNALRSTLETPISTRLTSPTNRITPPPFVYSNFRVFTRTDPAHEALESQAVEAAAAVVALCPVDAQYITEKLSPREAAVAPEVVLPPLRHDIRRLAMTAAAAATAATAEPSATCTTVSAVSAAPALCIAVPTLTGDVGVDTSPPPPPPPSPHAVMTKPWRRHLAPSSSAPPRRVFLTCCVRLSPEKEPERYVELVEELARRGVVGPRAGGAVVPLLCASTGGTYAQVRGRLEMYE